jgi:hypothetical protein
MAQILAETGPVFTYAKLSTALVKRGFDKTQPVEQTAHHLFSTSWIGNRSRLRGKNYYRFQHRARHGAFDPKLPCILHPGLIKALNVP